MVRLETCTKARRSEAGTSAWPSNCNTSVIRRKNGKCSRRCRGVTGKHEQPSQPLICCPHRLPKIYHLGWEGDYHAIVMEMLGDNLEMRCEANNRTTTPATVGLSPLLCCDSRPLQIAWTAIKCLDMLEALHKKVLLMSSRR